ncbi:hypothetical protein TNCV_4886851 [Trichonephila clavipes]|uniref:Uncharacterized protein n=1 Tax=Trichonephila clavipes TaxID=2585209 RepID=A0A8X6V7A7_TRICX|nr:hypothetical protein TNCV_4886851 [Trichonephila clavipes]
MTENDAPESTRARIGFLSIITSSWLPVILAVDGGFPVHAASPPWKVALLSFPRFYGLATDWIGDMATGICNDVLGSASRGLGVKRREEFGRRISSSVPTSSKFRRRFREFKDSLSLSAVAHYMSGRPQWKQTGLLSAVLHTSVFLGSGGNF